jgi:hypothetical protein
VLLKVGESVDAGGWIYGDSGSGDGAAIWIRGLCSTATRMVFELHGRRDPDYRGWSKAISNHTMQISKAFRIMHSIYSRYVVKVYFVISNKTMQIQYMNVSGS